MNFEDDTLQKIPVEKLLELRDLYKSNWPYGIYIYYFIEMSYHWIQKYNFKKQFYCLENTWQDGSFVCITEKDNGVQSLEFFSLNSSSNSKLYNALKNTRRIQWNQKISVDIMHKDQFDLYFQLLCEKQFITSFFLLASYWWLPKEEAIKFDIKLPENTYVDKLSETHVDKIHQFWPYKGRNYIQQLLHNNGSIGLFNKDSDELMAWITIHDSGVLGILRTDEKHQRKGYATIVTKTLCKQLAENGTDPVSFIITGNNASEQLFQKLGFRMINYLSWSNCKPI